MLSVAELQACGLSLGAIARRARRGTLHRLHRGVYAVGHRNVPLEGRFLAAVKALGPNALLSHCAAAAGWELVEWDDRLPEVTVPGRGTLGMAGVRVHRSTTLVRSDIRRHKGIPMTSPVRTVIDLAAVLGHQPLRRAVRQALSLRLVSVRRLQQRIDALGRFRGKRNLVRILADGPTATRSELEDVVLDPVLGAGFERPELNVPLVLDGRRVVPDFRWPAQKLVVEADGRAWHDHKLAREDDAERQALLEAHGERVVRLTWHQAIARPSESIARLRAAGAPLAHRDTD